MHIPETDYQILQLTDAFYTAYPNPPYREILKKRRRAYNCLLFQTHYEYYICVPYRSEIHHKNAFLFSKSIRSKSHKSGLDYSKIVIITKNEYINATDAIIDKDEFKETMINLAKIKAEALQYVEEYVAHMNGINVLHKREFERRYGFSALPYFHKELQIYRIDEEQKR